MKEASIWHEIRPEGAADSSAANTLGSRILIDVPVTVMYNPVSKD